MNNWSTPVVKRRKGRVQNNVVVLANVAAVINGLKPSYLIDHAVSSVGDVDIWLCDICNQLRPQCRLSILIIETQLFLVDINLLRDHLLKIISGKDIKYGVLVDVSFTLKRPKVRQQTDCQMIVKECAQVSSNFYLFKHCSILLY